MLWPYAQTFYYDRFVVGLDLSWDFLTTKEIECNLYFLYNLLSSRQVLLSVPHCAPVIQETQMPIFVLTGSESRPQTVLGFEKEAIFTFLLSQQTKWSVPLSALVHKGDLGKVHNTISALNINRWSRLRLGLHQDFKSYGCRRESRIELCSRLFDQKFLLTKLQSSPVNPKVWAMKGNERVMNNRYVSVN